MVPVVSSNQSQSESKRRWEYLFIGVVFVDAFLIGYLVANKNVDVKKDGKEIMSDIKRTFQEQFCDVYRGA